MRKDHDKKFRIMSLAAALFLTVSASFPAFAEGGIGPGGPVGPGAAAVCVGEHQAGPGVYVDVNGTAVDGVFAKGISVSKYQNEAGEKGIDWQKVKNSGISFVYVRMGYLDSLDPYFEENVRKASEAGLEVGVYFYTQALDEETVRKEAEFVLSQVKALDVPIRYPIAYDLESKYLLDQGMTKEQLADHANLFCSLISEAGYRPIIYANHQWLTEHIDSSRLGYDIWYARYGSTHEFSGRTIWQCTHEGTVDGIEGNVTIEYDFVNYPTLAAEG